MTIKCLEEYLMLCREQMLKHGPLAGQVVVIFDMQGFNLRQYLWRPGKIYMHYVIHHYYINFLWYINLIFENIFIRNLFDSLYAHDL